MSYDVKLVNKDKAPIYMEMYDIELARDMAKSFDYAEITEVDTENIIEKYENGEIIKVK